MTKRQLALDEAAALMSGDGVTVRPTPVQLATAGRDGRQAAVVKFRRRFSGARLQARDVRGEEPLLVVRFSGDADLREPTADTSSVHLEVVCLCDTSSGAPVVTAMFWNESEPLVMESDEAKPLARGLGVLSATVFLARLAEETDRALRFDRPLSLSMLASRATEVDLPRTSALIRRSLRLTDVIGTLDSERWVILQPETGIDAACGVAERLSKSMAMDVAGVDVGGGWGIGVASLLTARDGVELLAQARDALVLAELQEPPQVVRYLDSRFDAR